MMIIFFRTMPNEYTDRLLDAVSSVIAMSPLHVCGDIDSFVRELLAHRVRQPIVIVQVGSLEDLAGIKALSDILDGLFLIVAMDRHDEALSFRCRELYPRFLTHGMDDLGVVAAMIKKRLAVNGDGYMRRNR
ncbi:MAG: hypothetical protein CR984_03605 [Proteobacteria bacterium]|nr:MAG: hypothetical protein CR984_03605 [Pseudomonadota bacterium]